MAQQFIVQLQNRPGALASLSEALAARGVDLRAIGGGGIGGLGHIILTPADAPGSIERRVVTVLFADLVGFTSLSERLYPEDVAAIPGAYLAAVRETVARHGGRLEKFIGDAAMAVFGLPRGRDDDAERAVRAGLALVGAVERLGAQLGLDEGELRLRVGIESGEVVAAEAGPDEGRVTGDTVNTAARLQAAAPPGEVLLGEGASLAVPAAVRLGPR